MPTSNPNPNSNPNSNHAGEPRHQGGRPEPTGLPLRGSVFSDPAAEVVWSAVQALDEASKHDLLQALGEHLAVAYDRAGAQQQRVARAVAALREAHQQLIRELPAQERPESLGVNAYRELRERYPERGWPAPSLITRWIGGGWNDALRQAHLPTVPGEDVTKVTLGGAFTLDELVAAVRECWVDLGRVPSFMDYRRWATSPQVRVRPGRRPQSQPPFDRVCGGWLQALRAAERLTDGPSGPQGSVAADASHGEAGGACAGSVSSGVSVRPRGYRYTPEQMGCALRECAEDLGRPPRVSEYHRWREERQREEDERGLVPQLRPQHSVFNRLFPTWDDALADADLQPLGGRATASKAPERDGHHYTEQELVDTVARALTEMGEPLSGETFVRWRKRTLTDMRRENPQARLPSLHVIATRLGSWWIAMDQAHNLLAQRGVSVPGSDARRVQRRRRRTSRRRST